MKKIANKKRGGRGVQIIVAGYANCVSPNLPYFEKKFFDVGCKVFYNLLYM